MLERIKSKYNAYRLVYLIDIVGIFFSIVALSGFFLQDYFPSENLKSFSQNFGVEMMGTWLSVRLIDFLIQQREKADNIRTKTLRNLRFWINTLHPFLAVSHFRELERLNREYKYTEGMSHTWREYLSEIERFKFDELMLCLSANIALAKELGTKQRSYNDLYRFVRFNLNKFSTSNIDDKAVIIELEQKRHDLHNVNERLISISESYIHDYKSTEIESDELLSKFAINSEIFNIDFDKDEAYKLFTDIIQCKEKLETRYRDLENDFSSLELDIREETVEM